MPSLRTDVESVLASLAGVVFNGLSLLLSLLLLSVHALQRTLFGRDAALPARRAAAAWPRVVLVTGASSGIGAALARRYAALGVTLVLTGRSHERLSAVAKACEAKGARVVQGILDVTQRDEMQRFLLETDAQHPIDLVIANAGVSSAVLGFAGLEQSTRQLEEINVVGVYNTILPLLARFKERRTGQIAVVSSLSGIFDFPRGLAYAAGKASINVYLRGLRQVMRHYNVGVSTICPGFVETGFTAHTRAAGRATPMIISADAAAKIIADRLAQDDPVIAFPLPMYLLVSAFSALPTPIAHILFGLIEGSTKHVWERLG